MSGLRTALATLSILALAACASSGPQSIGGGKFMASARVPFNGQTGAKTKALETANKHCASLGKEALVEDVKASECALHGGCGEAEVVYRCVDKGSAAN
jgi:hypothetical protein